MTTINTVSPPFTVQFERVTPERAQALIDTQPNDGASKNRNRSLSRVERYANDMRQGFWDVTHQGIAVDESGILMDGQHRLQAVIESGVATEMMLCIGVKRETFPLVDGGLTRSAQSFLSGKYASQRTALARTLMRLDECGGVAKMSQIGNGQYPSHRILNFLENRADVRSYGEGYSGAAVRASDRKNGHFVGTSVVGLLTGGFIVGPDNWTRWWEDVHAMREGDGLPDGNPIKALWRAAPVGGNMTNVNYMRAIYAAVKFRDGEPLKLLRESNYREVKVW